MNSVIGTNSWTWLQYCQDRGQDLEEQLDTMLAQVAEAGLTAWEGWATSAQQAEKLAGLLAKYGLVMPTIYAGAKLHVPEWRDAVAEVVRQADLARPLGTRIVVCNPDPIDWGSKQDKSDDELRRQARAMIALGEELGRRDMVLAYHTHDAELRASARELHHMMLATKEAGVKLCLDTHWLYRGASNSNVALLDFVTLYGDRIASLHLRQSQGQIWSEVLGSGDVELESVAGQLKAIDFSGPIILEICAEPGTPRTLTPVEAHRRSREWIERVFLGRAA